MSETLVDARGKTCPLPLILTRRALNVRGPQDVLVVLVDNESSRRNVERYLVDHALDPSVTAEQGVFEIRVPALEPGAPAARGPSSAATPAAPADLAAPSTGTWVVALGGDTIGRGPAELGAVLMHGLLAALKDVTPRPTHLLLYSSGAVMALEGSPHLEALKALQQAGVEVLVCGTCVSHYGSTVRAGTVSNMLELLEIMARAGKVLSP